jgi:GDPmannose 4,6-dehydratase
MSKALIFGISGQDGYYLRQLLAAEGVTVTGASRSPGPWLQGDVADRNFVCELIRKTQPDFIFHFAAQSTSSHDALWANAAAIGQGALAILEAVRLHCRDCRVFIAGSALQFRNDGCPINEQTPFAASSAYALARIHATYAARYYRSQFGVKAYVGYFFHHESPRRPESHLSQKIARAAQRIATGSKERLRLGRGEVRKEYNFAGDIVRAAWMLLQQDRIDEVVIGCGRVHSIQEWADACFAAVGLHWQDYVDWQDGFTPEYAILQSDPTLLFSLSWQAAVSFPELANMMVKGLDHG